MKSRLTQAGKFLSVSILAMTLTAGPAIAQADDKGGGHKGIHKGRHGGKKH